MQFADILASSVHDIKNSLGMVLNRLDELSASGDDAPCDQQLLRLIKQETARANTSLIQLLQLYKHGNDALNPEISEWNLAEFLEELAMEHRSLIDNDSLAIDYLCDEELNWYFDEDLLRGVIATVIGNAMRYSHSMIQLSAEEQDGWLVIHVDDDGGGYPESMINATEQGIANSDSAFARGRTGLGLYFSELVAGCHQNNQRQGHIRLSNGRALSGGCFSIFLP